MTTYSDLLIPERAAIVDRARDLHASAIRLQDAPTARQLDRLIANAPAAGLRWVLGALHIESKSGGAYRVTRGGCSCPNGQLGRWQCWHIAMFHLLLEMLDTEAETRDMEADLCFDPPGDNPLGDEPGDELPTTRWSLPGYGAPLLSCGLPNPLYRVQEHERTLGERIATARATYDYAA